VLNAPAIFALTFLFPKYFVSLLFSKGREENWKRPSFLNTVKGGEKEK